MNVTLVRNCKTYSIWQNKQLLNNSNFLNFISVQNYKKINSKKY